MPSVAPSPLLPTDTVTVVSLGNVSPSVAASTVTVFLPPSSVTLSGVAVSVMSVLSLSVIVTAAVNVVPRTLTLSVSLPSTTVSSVGVRVKVPVTLVAPPAMVSSKSSTAAKSVPEVAVPLVTPNEMSTASATVTPPVVTVTVMVVAPALSATVFGVTVRVGEVLSLSFTYPPAGVTVTPVEVPLAVSVSGGSRRESRLAVVVNLALPLVWPLLMVMVKSLTAV